MFRKACHPMEAKISVAYLETTQYDSQQITEIYLRILIRPSHNSLTQTWPQA